MKYSNESFGAAIDTDGANKAMADATATVPAATTLFHADPILRCLDIFPYLRQIENPRK